MRNSSPYLLHIKFQVKTDHQTAQLMFATCFSLVFIKTRREPIKAPESFGTMPDRQPYGLLHKPPSAALKLLPCQQHRVLLQQVRALLSHQQLGPPPILHLGPHVALPQRLPLLPVDDGRSREVGTQQDGHLCHCEGKVSREVTELGEASVHLPAVGGQVWIFPQVVSIEDGNSLETLFYIWILKKYIFAKACSFCTFLANCSYFITHWWLDCIFCTTMWILFLIFY